MNGFRTILVRPKKARKAFSLIELLVVIAIIGIMATIGLPALKGMGGTNDISAATRQLLDDLAYARIKAINERTTVYVVFVSDAILFQPWSVAERKEIARHANLQYTSYALFVKRSLGDQPGPGTPRYLTDWRTLPDGTFIPTNKFNLSAATPIARRNETLFARPFFFADDNLAAGDKIPFPLATSKPIILPFIAFDYQGRLRYPASMSQQDIADVIVPIAKGSIVYPQEDKDKLQAGSLDAAEVIYTPRGNHTNNPSIRIDWLTGRARMVRPEKVNYKEL